MNHFKISKHSHRQTNINTYKFKSLITKCVRVKRVYQEPNVNAELLEITIKKNWPNVCDLCLSLALKDNQLYIDINMREDVEKKMKDEIYNETTFNDSIEDVLFQLNTWQVAQYTINVIDTYAALMKLDKDKSVSIPLSICVQNID